MSTSLNLELDPAAVGAVAFPAFVFLIALEVWLLKRRGQVYPWRETRTSLLTAFGYKLANSLSNLVLVGVYFFVWEHRIYTVPMSAWWAWPLLFVGQEFFYYWFHRFNHECRWMWANHSVHHSPEIINFAASYRVGWAGILAGNWLFWLPLIWLGFHPASVFLVLGLNLLYQIWLHTELVGKLGPLEWFLNTPSHHRVHHARNGPYIDKNHGGVLIVFDRLFGTFASEKSDEPCRFGLVKPIGTERVLAIQVHEWRCMWNDVRKAKTWRSRLQYLFGRPGWSPSEAMTVPAGADAPALVEK